MTKAQYKGLREQGKWMLEKLSRLAGRPTVSDAADFVTALTCMRGYPVEQLRRVGILDILEKAEEVYRENRTLLDNAKKEEMAFLQQQYEEELL